MSLDAYPVSRWTPAEVAEVRSAFELGEPIAPPEYPTHAGWDRQRARCVVSTERGRWFLKKHHPRLWRRETHALMRMFRELGGSAPETAALPSGETWYRLPSGNLAEVRRFLPGKPITTPTDDIAAQAAEQVALVHRLPAVAAPAARTGWYEPSQTARLAPGVLEKLAAHGLPSAELERLFAAEARSQPAAAQPPARHVVHGDLWRGNWLAENGRIVALLDFDWAHRGNRVEDIADVLLALCSDRDADPDAEINRRTGQPVHHGRFGAMLARYEEVNGSLTDEERSGLPEMLRSQLVRHALWILRREEDTVHLEVTLRRTVRIARTLSLFAARRE